MNVATTPIHPTFPKSWAPVEAGMTFPDIPKVVGLAVRVFPFLRQVAVLMIGFGTLFQGIRFYKESGANKTSFVFWQVLYGAGLFISGILGVTAEFNYLVDNEVSSLYKKCSWTANITFIFACLSGLRLNHEKYKEGLELSKSEHTADHERGVRMLYSAVTGVLACLSYLISTLFFLFEVMTGWAILLCVIGCAFSTFQVIYEYFFI